MILYEMLTGMAPFTGSTPAEIAAKHVSDPPLPPRQIVAAIPEDIERVVLHAMEKAPEDRPANAGDFRQELLETAERLGLEYHALTSAPDIEAYAARVESPSVDWLWTLRACERDVRFEQIKVVGGRTATVPE